MAKTPSAEIILPTHKSKPRKRQNAQKKKKKLKRCLNSVQIPHINDERVPEIQSETNPCQNKNKIKKKKQKKCHKILKFLGEKKICPPELLANPKCKKYWPQRYQLFSKFDQGIQLDLESWYSVTPEKIAMHHADRCRTDGVIIDAFCGCGGNSIQFAMTCSHVYAIDIDLKKLEFAKANARIYGVEDKITFIHGDFMALAPCLKANVVFLSPPWGGPDYARDLIFDLTTMTPLDGTQVFRAAQTITPNIGYYLPKNVHSLQLEELAAPSLCEFERNLYNGKDKAVTVYFGDLIRKC